MPYKMPISRHENYFKSRDTISCQKGSLRIKCVIVIVDNKQVFLVLKINRPSWSLRILINEVFCVLLKIREFHIGIFVLKLFGLWFILCSWVS